MNQPTPDMYYSSHMSGGHVPPPQGIPTGGMCHYQQHQPPALMQPGPGQYSSGPPAPYGQYSYGNGLASPQQAGHQIGGPMGSHGNVMSLPPMSAGQGGILPGSNYPPQQQQQQQGFDTTGQQAPPGMKPRVTATLWEDEGSLCFQVEAKGVCVARREDNHMINGTKLLNVAGMTRGRRDGILKSEKQRHVVKIGPMHLKGVWIPFERALDFANKEKITELLYPLFVHHIGQLLYHPTNQNRTNVVMQAAERRKAEQSHMRGAQVTGSLPSLNHHHHSMQGSIPGQHSIAPNTGIGRPDIQRAHTFPTPPTSASSVMENMGNTNGFWNGQNMGSVQGAGPLAIDTGLSNSARSMPTTPATTPPGTSVQGMQYQQTPQSYDGSRSQIYSTPGGPQTAYSQSGTPQGMGRYGQGTSYIKNEMGPPLGRAPGADDHDSKSNNGLMHHDQGSQPGVPGHGDEEAEHDHDGEYTHDSHAGYENRSYTYPTAGGLAGDRTHLSQDINGSPGHQGGSGRATPRTTAAPQPYYQQAGYHTPPQILPPSSNLYNVMSSERGTAGGSGGDVYGAAGDSGSAMSNGYALQPSAMSNTIPSGKRSRDDDDEARPLSRGGEIEGGLKRRKTIKESSVPSPQYDAIAGRNRVPPIAQRRR